MPGRSLQAAGVPPSKSGGSMSECTKWSQSIEWIVSYRAVVYEYLHLVGIVSRTYLTCWPLVTYVASFHIHLGT